MGQRPPFYQSAGGLGLGLGPGLGPGGSEILQAVLGGAAPGSPLHAAPVEQPRAGLEHAATTTQLTFQPPPGGLQAQGLEGAWQSQSHSLEQLGAELQQAQQHLLRQQISKFNSNFNLLWQEVAALKARIDGAHDGISSMVDSKIRDLGDQINSISDVASMHGKTHELTKIQLDQLSSRLDGCEKHGAALNAIQHQVDGLAGDTGMLVGKNNMLHDRLGQLAGNIAEVSDRQEAHSRSLEAHAQLHARLESDMASHAARHASLAECLKSTEAATYARIDTESSAREAHVAALENLKAAHAALTNNTMEISKCCLSTEQHLKSVEDFVGGLSGEHAQKLEQTQRQLQDVHNQVMAERRAQEAHNMNMSQHMQLLDTSIQDAKGVHAAELEAAHKKIREIDGHLKEQRDARDRYSATVHERFHHLEQRTQDLAEKHNQHLKDSEAVSAHLRDLRGFFKKEADANEAHRASQAQQMKFLEKAGAERAGEHSRSVQVLQREVQSLSRRVAEHGHSRDVHQSTIGEGRLASVEGAGVQGLGPAAAACPAMEAAAAGAAAQVQQQGGGESPAGSMSGSSKFALPRFGPADMGHGDLEYLREVTSLILRNDGLMVRDQWAHRTPVGQAAPRPKMGRGVSLPSLSETQ